jgi:hypothetical protein
MKTRHFSVFSLATAYVFLTSASAVVVGGCGGSKNNTTIELLPENKLSDFEDIAAATIVQAGSPMRNGYWYTYNDDNPKGTDATCMQTPPSGPQLLPDPPATYKGETPPTNHMGITGFALHGMWSGCSVWGAGIGADINQPAAEDGGTYNGPKVPYNVAPYIGVAFWAMAKEGTDTALRMKFPMTDETKIADGGDCDEAVLGVGKCSDDFGKQFNLPSNGTWKQFTVLFADTAFKQEGWGQSFTWNPAHVTSIQIQSVDKTEPYDFWIDDLYFLSP